MKNIKKMTSAEKRKVAKLENFSIILFLALIFVSILGALIFPKYSLIIFGQYIFLLGLIIVWVGPDKFAGIPFVLIGLTCTIGTILKITADIDGVVLNWGAIIPVLILSGMVLVALSIIMITLPDILRTKKYYSVKIKATIIKNSEKRKKGYTLYSPTYQFDYGNETYEVDSKSYSNVGIKPVGAKVNIKINPDNPQMIMHNTSVGCGPVAIGLFMIVVILPLLIYLIFNVKFTL